MPKSESVTKNFPQIMLFPTLNHFPPQLSFWIFRFPSVFTKIIINDRSFSALFPSPPASSYNWEGLWPQVIDDDPSRVTAFHLKYFSLLVTANLANEMSPSTTRLMSQFLLCSDSGKGYHLPRSRRLFSAGRALNLKLDTRLSLGVASQTAVRGFPWYWIKCHGCP